MGRLKEWLMSMEEDSHHMTNNELTEKYGELGVKTYFSYKQSNVNDYYEIPDDEKIDSIPIIDEPPF